MLRAIREGKDGVQVEVIDSKVHGSHLNATVGYESNGAVILASSTGARACVCVCVCAVSIFRHHTLHCAYYTVVWSSVNCRYAKGTCMIIIIHIVYNECTCTFRINVCQYNKIIIAKVTFKDL